MSFFLPILVFITLSAAMVQAKLPAIHGAIPDGLGAPLLFVEKHHELKGIVPDYTRALISAMGRDGDLVLLTRYRLKSYQEDGKVDFLCYTSRAWAEDKDNFDWSKTVLMKREVILGPAPMPKTIPDLAGRTLGTMLNYVYPRLEALFKSHRISREDSASEDANLNKVLKGRLQYVVTDEIFLDYYKTKHSLIEKNRARLFLQDYPVACSISRKGNVNMKDLNKAIETIKNDGTMSRIFKKYGVSY